MGHREPLAGGIGLSGGACGALGAAVWLTEMTRGTQGSGSVEFNSPEASETIDRIEALAVSC